MLKFENPINGRYYYLDVQRDLFNHRVLVVFRGGYRHTRIEHIFFADDGTLRTELLRRTKRRIARGYVLKENSLSLSLQ
jgi:hypothetical protein